MSGLPELDLRLEAPLRAKIEAFLASITDFEPTLSLFIGPAKSDGVERWSYDAYRPEQIRSIGEKLLAHGKALVHRVDGLNVAIPQFHRSPELVGKTLALSEHGLVLRERSAPVRESGGSEAALALHAAGALAEAEAAYRRLLADDPLDGQAQHDLGVLLHQRGQSQQGLALIRRGLSADAGSASRFNDLGNILAQTGALGEAAAAFKSSLELDGEDANVWNNLGSVLQRQSDLAGAESAYRSALRCEADFVPALSNLAALLEQSGRDEESSLLSCRAFVLPPLAGKTPKMLGIAYYRLGRIADAAQCYRAWLRDEPDNAVARHLLAACTGDAVPQRAPDEYVTALFDEMAEDFDERLLGSLSYRGPQIIAALLEGHLRPGSALDVLDAGCGTGLCAAVLRPYAAQLVGVDLSPAMLRKARHGKLYTELVEAELTAFLVGRRNRFDLIVMADTLIYFGNLAALFGAVGAALRAGGSFAFTVETVAPAAPASVDFCLSPSGRYAHSERYLRSALEAAGLAVLRSEAAVLRTEFCQPTAGIGVLARAMPCPTDSRRLDCGESG